MAAKQNKTGRSTVTRRDFIIVERYMMRSVAWRSLTPLARATYLEICFCYDGCNNGRIAISVRTLGERLGANKSTASRAVRELVDLGFIEIVKRGAFSVKSKLAAEYRLTAFKCNVTGALPSKAFLRWAPEIQNSDALVQPDGVTHATDGTKTTSNSPNQLH